MGQPPRKKKGGIDSNGETKVPTKRRQPESDPKGTKPPNPPSGCYFPVLRASSGAPRRGAGQYPFHPCFRRA